MKKLLLLFSLFTALIGQISLGQISCGIFNNAGVMRSESSDFVADVLNNTGTIEGVDYVNLQCDKLLGNGVIKGPRIEIFATECEYEGLIDCSGTCLLVTNTPKSKLKFNFVGGGKLIIKKLGE